MLCIPADTPRHFFMCMCADISMRLLTLEKRTGFTLFLPLKIFVVKYLTQLQCGEVGTGVNGIPDSYN